MTLNCICSIFVRIFGFCLALLSALSTSAAFGQSAITVAPVNNEAGKPTLYTVSFTLSNTLPKSGKITIAFRSTFDLSGVLVADGQGALDGGLTPSVSDSTILFTRDGTGTALAAGLQVAVRFALVTNSPVASNSYQVAVAIRNAVDAVLAGPSLSPSFSIVAGPLSLLEFAMVPDQRAGTLTNLTLRVKDAFGNPVNHTGQVVLTDNTGTLRNGNLNFINQSSLSPTNVIIEKAQASVFITATVSPGGQTGKSNFFKLDPGSLTKVRILTGLTGNTAELGEATLSAGQSVNMHAGGFDAFNNFVSVEPVTWFQTPPGTFLPFAGGSSSTFTLSDTLGPVAGRVIAVHDFAGTDTTGIITYLPGAATGEVELTADPDALPADGVAISDITSAKIRDRYGNLVGPGRVFTVALNDTTLGRILDADVDPNSPFSIQDTTNSASRLRLQFQPKTKGGTANLNVVGGSDGSASGSVAISVNQLRILSVSSTIDTVSIGQQGIAVTMAVQNVGRDSVTLNAEGTTLLFNGANKDYRVTLTSPTLPALIPGDFQTTTLKFLVEVRSGAKSGLVTLDGRVSGTVVTSGDLSDTGADVTDRWLVQTAPQLTYEAGSLSPTNLSVGSSYQFRLTVSNTGEAPVNLNPQLTTIEFTAAGGAFNYRAALDANHVTSIQSGQTTLVFQLAQVSSDFPVGDYSVRTTVTGTQNGAAFSKTMDTDTVRVKSAQPLEIVNVRPSQSTVTQSMNKQWTLTLDVRNNSSLPMMLQDMSLKIVVNGVQDDSYDILLPNSFLPSDQNSLPPDSTEALRFAVRKTGNISGFATVFASVRTNDGAASFDASTNGTQGSFLVETPAILQIELEASQKFVTQNQTQDWEVAMRVTNSGQSDVAIDSNLTGIAFQNSQGFVVLPPTNIDGSVIDGGKTQSFAFIVDQTGSVLGSNAIHGIVTARELNSGNELFKQAQGNDGDTVTVQSPATIFIDQTLVAQTFNADSVNKSQKFEVRVKLDRQGEEGVEAVAVKLTTDGGSQIANNLITVTDLNQPAVFAVTADTVLTASETFLASIDSSASSNTKAPLTVGAPRDDFAHIFIDNPAGLEVLGLSTTLPNDTVSANRTQPWFVTLHVRARNNASHVRLDPIKALKLTIRGETQTDYRVVAPAGLSDGGLLLHSGRTDSLVYQVTQTGRNGGDLIIDATVDWKDNNDHNRRFTANVSDTVQVLTQTSVFVIRTALSPSVNQLPGSGIGLVNTNQTLQVHVDVRNEGFERVDSLFVSLRSRSGASLIQPSQLRIENLDNQLLKTAIFTILAPISPTSDGQLEIYEARIDSAFTATTLAKIAGAIDSTAEVQVQRPALLRLTPATNVANNQLTAGQSFKIIVNAENLGDAEYDDAGRLQIASPLPPGFAIDDNSPRILLPGRAVEWNVTEQSGEVRQADFIIAFSTLPRDRNSGESTQTVAERESLTVGINQSTIVVTRVLIPSPSGAQDGILSTEQDFVVTAEVNVSPNVKSKSASIELPSGYGLAEGENVVKVMPDSANTASWNVKAPQNDHSTERLIVVSVSGQDANGQVGPASEGVAVRAAPRAEFVLLPEISDPPAAPGIVSRLLSVGQNFKIRARLQNEGSPTTGTARIRLALGVTDISVEESLERVVAIDSVTRSGVVEWTALAPPAPTERSPLLFVVTEVPLDQNTNDRAKVRKISESLEVETVDRGLVGINAVRIVDPEGATDDTLSTGQNFVVRADLSWIRAANVQASIALPEGIGFSLPDDQSVKPLDGENGSQRQVFWKIQAPNQTVDSALIKVTLQAVDASNPAQALGPIIVDHPVWAVPRADLLFSAQITDPAAAALDGVIGVNQSFEVAAIFENNGQATAVGVDSIQVILPEGYRLDSVFDSLDVKSSQPHGLQRRAVWRVIAPPAPSANVTTGDLIRFRLRQRARDENSGEVVQVDAIKFDLRVITEARKLMVAGMPVSRPPSAARGQTAVQLMRLELSSPGSSSLSTNIQLQQIRFQVIDQNQRVVAPDRVLSGASLVADDNLEHVFGEVMINPVPPDNTVLLTLEEPVIVSAETTTRVALLGDFTDSDSVNVFGIRFNNGAAFDAIDMDSGLPVQIVDAQNRSGADFKLASSLAVLVAAELSSFSNYPNPLQPGDLLQNLGTTFRYYLPEQSAIDLKIFTLLGELVWEVSYNADSPQGRAGMHDREITWNGLNGDNKEVLNGVYLAVLKTGSGTAVTKVAVVK